MKREVRAKCEAPGEAGVAVAGAVNEGSELAGGVGGAGRAAVSSLPSFWVEGHSPRSVCHASKAPAALRSSHSQGCVCGERA